MIQELADYEKVPTGPKIGPEILERDGFETDPPLFYCYVAEELKGQQEGGSKLVGLAFFYYTYSTWNGKKMNLADLYVSETYRNLKIGTRLITAVVKKAAAEGCAQLDFTVLDWNPAKKFYEKLGAKDYTETDGLHQYILEAEAFHRIAKS